ncbi:MAG: cytochrome c3 family protein, partial [Desulfobulbaceae bacterium]|nr:cytochrome c3 family protein [Desulfobulbaceae bacterium]
MKKLILMCCLVLMTASGSLAAVIDAPHNDTYGIKCSACHSYSLWWQYSPTTQNPAPNDHTAIVDAVCMTCHSGSGPQPKAMTHSSTVMNSTLHGAWGVGCMACHNPHYQDQLTWAGTATSPYLVTGTINGAVYDSILDQTTITYANATTNVNWPVEGALASDPDWANKSLSNPNRGLILVQDNTLKSNTFLILSATPSQVVVKGNLTANAIDPTYINPVTGKQNPATCNSFGLIYGQLIRSTINAKAVKFFDPNGGFVEAGTGTTGICQVCHTPQDATHPNGVLHFGNDGVLPLDSHVGRQTLNCTTCHKHDVGFKGVGGHDNTTFVWDGDCNTCHSDGGLGIVDGVHKSTCTLCHSTASGGKGTTIVGLGGDGNATLGAALADYKTAGCLACHPSATYPKPWIHHDTAPAVAGACVNCHATTNGHAGNHTITVSLSANCALCHTGTEGGLNNVPVDLVNNKIHDACTTCHQIDMTTKKVIMIDPLTSTLVIAMPDGGTVGGVDGGGTCETCHGAYFPKHTAANHTAKVVGAADCISCHTATAGTATGVPVSATDNKVHDACSTCHNVTTGALVPTPTANGWAVAVTAGDCTTCHGAYFDMHVHGTTGGYTTHDLTHNPIVDLAQVDSKPCLNCHDDAGLGLGTLALSTWNAIKVEHATLGGVAQTSACATCHSYATRGNQSGGVDTPPLVTVESVIATGINNTCVSCHTAKLAPAAHGGHNATTFVWDGDCNTCHSDGGLGIVDGVHKSTCTLCHSTASGGKGTTIVGLGGDGNATLGAALADYKTAGCLACHPSATYPKPWIHHDTAPAVAGACVNCHATTNGHAGNHTITVSLSANCALCHTGTEGGLNNVPVDLVNNKIHDACTTCHQIDMTTKNVIMIDPLTSTLVIAMPDGGTVGGVDGGGTCETCHGAYFSQHKNIDHATSRVTGSANCSTCHDAVAGGTAPDAITAPFTTAGEVHGVRACATCHTTTGALVASSAMAPGIAVGGGSCEICHGAYFPNHRAANHTAKVVDTTNCNSCHTATAGTATGVPVSTLDNKVHDACTTCHNVTTGALLTVALANDPTTAASVTTMAAGDCNGCHGTYFTQHANINHATSRVTVSANCATCHDAVAGGTAPDAITAPFTGVGEVHGVRGCATCHNTTTGALAATSVMAPGIGVGGGSCETCHGLYFQNHTQHNATTHAVLMRATDLSNGSACNTCHRRGGTTSVNPLFTNTWGGTDGIYSVHQLGCTECHDSTRTINVGAGYTSVNNVIMTAVTPGCLDCHADRSAAHGGHNATDFVADTACTTCHSATDIVATVHKNKCADCHMNPLGGGVRRAGTDGSALLGDASGLHRLATCLTCHPVATYPTGGIHHDTVTAANNNCITCHAAVNHTTMIATTTACTGCHTATAGTSTGAPVSTTNSMVHDSCRTCHTFNAQNRGILVNFTNAKGVNGTGSLPDGGTIGGTNGGGACTVCHTVATPSTYHHTSNYRVVGNCEYCHADPR